MENIKAFLKKKNVEICSKRYGIDALGAMTQGLFASLLTGIVLNTIGKQFGLSFFNGPSLGEPPLLCRSPSLRWVRQPLSPFGWIGMALIGIVRPALICRIREGELSLSDWGKCNRTTETGLSVLWGKRARSFF